MGQLREKTNSLEDLLRMSRHTIKTLQAKLKDVQEEYKANLAAMDAQLKQMYQVAAAANANNSVASRSDRRLSREDVTNVLDRLRAQAILEGRPSDSDVQSELQSVCIAIVRIRFVDVNGNFATGSYQRRKDYRMPSSRVSRISLDLVYHLVLLYLEQCL